MMERPATPDQYDVMRAMIDQLGEDLHTAFPAKVQSYDAGTQTADLIPLVKHAVLQPDGSSALEALPVLPSVPVVFPRSGKAFVSLPIAPGDTMLVICCESAIGQFRVSDGTSPQPPGDLRRFNLSHAVAIPGLAPRTKALAHASITDIVIGFDDGARVSIKPDGSVHLATDTGTPLAMANATDARLNDLKTAINGWTPVANDGGAALKIALTTWLAGSSNVGATKVNGV